MSIEFPRFTACAIVEMAEGSGSGQATTVGRQDKKPHIAAWTVGCFVSDFFDFLHIADHRRDVRVCIFAKDFSEYRTSRVQL